MFHSLGMLFLIAIVSRGNRQMPMFHSLGMLFLIAIVSRGNRGNGTKEGFKLDTSSTADKRRLQVGMLQCFGSALPHAHFTFTPLKMVNQWLSSI
jgi:hypothetical protein